MEREEKFIIEKLGRRMPFRVPDGYFDDFVSQLMRNLPEQSHVSTTKIMPLKRSSWYRFHPIPIAAASISIAIFSLGIYLQNHHHNPAAVQDAPMANAAHASTYSAIDAMADYAMLDTEDMYTYMEDTE